ncbi:MAG: 50S ribosomal protein L9 [Nitrospinae bacterium]|nr:50S ribosomal protein L9 [Nitrospinota bacterium]
MRLILRKDIEHLGEVGDVVEVADGYGLNYLIPKGLALHATASTVRATQHEQRLREAQIQAAKRSAQDFAGEFSGIELEFSMRVGADGRLFGSVTNRMIEDALQEKGLEVNRRRIVLDEPIKKVGTYDVDIRLHQEVRASVQVKVMPDEASLAAAAEAEEAAEVETEEAAVAEAETEEAAAPEAEEAEEAADGDEVEAEATAEATDVAQEDAPAENRDAETGEEKAD